MGQALVPSMKATSRDPRQTSDFPKSCLHQTLILEV